MCVCVHVYMLLFLDSCRTSNKNLSHVFCWKGWASIRQTQPECLLNQTDLNGATNNSPVPPLAFWPTSIPLYTHRSRSPQPAAQIASQHQENHFLSGGSQPVYEENNVLRLFWTSLIFERDRAPACNSELEKVLVTCDRRCIWRDPFLTTARLAWIWMAGTVRTALGVKEASLRVPSMRTGPAGQWSVAHELLYTLFFSQTLNTYWQDTASTMWKHVTSRNPSETTSHRAPGY